MRQIREVLRLAQAKSLSPTEIAIAAHLPRTTVRNYLSRAAAAGLSWPLPEDLDDRGLEERLFGRPAPQESGGRSVAVPDALPQP
jgi:transposase